MKMKFKQHFPNYVTGFTPEEFTFEKTDELLNNECVLRFSENCSEKKFYRYSVSVDEYRRYLMAEYNNGDTWWVVGYIDGEGEINLPIWQYKKGE